ncbi:MAG: HAD-IA family hydrolase [Methyloceanibacter sp.]
MLKDATIVFDLDGTLVDSAPDLTNGLNDALIRRGHAPVAAEVIRGAVGRGARVMIETALGMAGIEDDVDQMLAEFLTHYEANIAAESRPFPGAADLLERLTERGARLAVCTNKRESLSRKLLQELRLSTHFAAIAGRDTFPVSKPDPGHLTGTIALAAGNPSRALMIGDSEFDFAAAWAAGVPIVLARFGYGPFPQCSNGRAAPIIDQLGELEALAGPLLRCAAAARTGTFGQNPAKDQSYFHPTALNEQP